MPRRTEEEALATRIAILDAAERVFYEKGVSSTRLEDIAQSAGVTRGAIYWHFKNKQEIFEAMHERVHNPINEMFMQVIGGGNPNSLTELKKLCIQFVIDLSRDEQKKRVYSIYFLKCEYAGELKPLIDIITQCKKENFNALCKYFKQLQSDGIIQTKYSPKILAQSLFSFMNGITLEYLRDPSRFILPQDAKKTVNLFFRVFET